MTHQQDMDRSIEQPRTAPTGHADELSPAAQPDRSVVVVDSALAVERRFGSLDIDSPLDQVKEAITQFEAWQERMAQLTARYKAWLLEQVAARGDIEIGTMRYFTGPDKSDRCTNKGKMLEAAYEHTGGDVDAVTNLMVAQPFKPGACRIVLGEKYGDYFVTEIKEVVKEGVAKVKKTDTAFIR